MSEEIPNGKGEFPVTRWTLVRKATQRDDPDSFEALSELCEAYWYPLYAFVRSQGAGPDDAKDEVQGFFSALLEKELFDSVDQKKGKLRTFLITALKRYRSKEYRAKQTLKRGGGKIHISIDQEWAEGRFEADIVDDLTPEQLMDRSWAKLLLDTTTEKLRSEYESQDNLKEYECLYPYLVKDSTTESYATAAAKLGIKEGNFKVRIHRFRSKFRKTFENAIIQTLDLAEGEKVEDELIYLYNAL